MEIIEAYAKYVELSKTIKELESQKKELSKQIIEAHGGAKAFSAGNYSSTLVHQVRKTPQVNIIESKFGITLTDDCFKITESDSVRVSLITE